jgi:chromosome segregation ATPase
MAERKHVERDGPGRRADDKAKCPWCDLRWDAQEDKWENHHEETTAWRTKVCREVGEIKDIVKTKADKEIVQEKTAGIMKTLTILVGICCLIVAGQALWLKADIKEIKSETQTIHRRITETDANREALKDKLTDLQWSINAVGNRLTQVEQTLQAHTSEKK